MAPGYMFIHRLYGYRTGDRGKGYASILIKTCEDDARDRRMSGVVVMTSDGVWMASKQVFLKNDYTVVDRRGRFELLVNRFDDSAPSPQLLAWDENLDRYHGWHLIYADQCPWHEKAARDLGEEALEHGIEKSGRLPNSFPGMVTVLLVCEQSPGRCHDNWPVQLLSGFQ